MTITLRRATTTDAKHVALLLTELGYPSTQADVQERLDHALHNVASCCLVAQSAGDVIRPAMIIRSYIA
jgi:hypothetical protein